MKEASEVNKADDAPEEFMTAESPKPQQGSEVVTAT